MNKERTNTATISKDDIDDPPSPGVVDKPHPRRLLVSGPKSTILRAEGVFGTHRYSGGKERWDE